MMLELCTEGDELLKIRQKIVYSKINELLDALGSIWKFQYQKTEYVKTAVDYSENIIKMFVPDRDYNRFFWNLYLLYLERAEISMTEHDFDGAVNYLAIAKEYAQKSDSFNPNGKCKYTCTIFDHVEDDLSCELSPTDSMDYWKYAVNKELFNPLRERSDFQKLING